MVRQRVKMISKLRGGVHSFVSLFSLWPSSISPEGEERGRDGGREEDREGEGKKSGRRISMASPSSEFQL